MTLVFYAIRLFRFLLLAGFCFFCTVVSAQQQSKTGIREIIDSVNAHTGRQAVEKLYIQTDKSAYTSGDTLWFKAYLFDAAYFTASAKSGIMYVEIASDSNRVIRRIMLPVYGGIAAGQVALEPKEMPSGSYILRAYTNWMRNFGEDYVFKKSFFISDVADKDWLVNYRIRNFSEEGKDKIQLSLKLNRFDKTPVGLREMQLRITEDQKTRLKDKVETSVDGLLNVNFDIPADAKAKNLLLTLQDLRKGEGNRSVYVPLLVNRPQQVDLQFMPEGGNLVAGIASRVAFKALNESGTGATVSGGIYDSKGQKVVDFSSGYQGMGAFNFLPDAGESYSARIKLPDGSWKNYPLPAIKNSGTVLQVDNDFHSDSCQIIIRATPDIATKKQGVFFLTGQARGVVCYGVAFHLNQKGEVKFMVAKQTFPSGIARFTLAGPDKIALNERIIFIDHADNLNIQFTANKTAYQKRDSVALDIRVWDKNGKPVQGTFSLAVTDDTQVKTDSIANSSIVSEMLLTSDLKGYVENPGYYPGASGSAKKWQELDYLLLTQGWVGYEWGDIFAPGKKPAYPAEPEFVIQGKVLNIMNKPVAGSGVTLLSKKPLLIKDTVTNEQGSFVFNDIFPVDTAVFFIQSKNKRNKSFNVGIRMDEFKPPVFTSPQRATLPWYVNIDTSRQRLMRKSAGLKNEKELIASGIRLQEVIVKAKKIIKDSKNLNGPGEADIIVGEEELEKAGRTSLGDLLEQKVKGFGMRVNKSGERYYAISGLMVHLIIDGIETEFFKSESESPYDHLKYYFDYYDAEEIKGIEVMTSTRYESAYRSEFLHPMAHPWEHAFIEVTTRSGHGPFVKKAVGTYLYKPMAFTLPKNFYSPKYKPGSKADMTDIRSTVYWNPNILTDKDGKASVSFYTADIPGSYSLLIEGSDMAGNLGAEKGKIVVGDKD